MKKFILLILFASLLLFAGCSNDDWDNDVPTKISFDGTEYEMSYLSGWELENSFSVEFVLKNGLAIYIGLENTGDCTAGHYTYSEKGEKGTFKGQVYSKSGQQITSYKEITSGRLTVRQRGKVYEIKLDAATVDGKEVFVYYKGKISLALDSPPFSFGQ